MPDLANYTGQPAYLFILVVCLRSAVPGTIDRRGKHFELDLFLPLL